MADLRIPDMDVLGEPTGHYEIIRSHWAVWIDAAVNDVAGPHLLACQDEAGARARLKWLQENRPDASPRLVRRKIVEAFGEWQATP